MRYLGTMWNCAGGFSQWDNVKLPGPPWGCIPREAKNLPGQPVVKITAYCTVSLWENSENAFRFWGEIYEGVLFPKFKLEFIYLFLISDSASDQTKLFIEKIENLSTCVHVSLNHSVTSEFSTLALRILVTLNPSGGNISCIFQMEKSLKWINKYLQNQ